MREDETMDRYSFQVFLRNIGEYKKESIARMIKSGYIPAEFVATTLLSWARKFETIQEITYLYYED